MLCNCMLFKMIATLSQMVASENSSCNIVVIF
jgi:hypothetical protein